MNCHATKCRHDGGCLFAILLTIVVLYIHTLIHIAKARNEVFGRIDALEQKLVAPASIAPERSDS